MSAVEIFIGHPNVTKRVACKSGNLFHCFGKVKFFLTREADAEYTAIKEYIILKGYGIDA
ncbi:MAG: hypothetical protein M1379_16455 [Firmicutes bacterium]|nr:hypothetical protein [Bacillota bacterium]